MIYEEIVRAVGNAAAIFKLVCGVGNNAAWVVMMHTEIPDAEVHSTENS